MVGARLFLLKEIMKNNLTIKTIKMGKYKLLHILSSPPRLEAKLVMSRDNISQKLLFTLMEISHQHGFSCSPPTFKGLDDSDMTFLIGTILPSNWQLKKFSKRLFDCLLDLEGFLDDFSRQLDFSQLDISMMSGIDLSLFDPSHIAAIRDQNFNGSWEAFKNTLLQNDQIDEMQIVEKCISFENTNNKDLGLVGHKLDLTLGLLENQFLPGEKLN